jgi:hypothetical protein
LILTLPLALSVIIFSASWMSIFGPAFRDGATALSVGAIGQIFNCVVGSVGLLLLMSDKQTSLMKIQVVNAIVMVPPQLAFGTQVRHGWRGGCREHRSSCNQPMGVCWPSGQNSVCFPTIAHTSR